MQFPCEDEGPGQQQIARCLFLWGWPTGDQARMVQGEFLLFSSWQEMTAKFQMKQMKFTQLFRAWKQEELQITNYW